MITATGDMSNRLSTRSILDGYKLILTSLLVLMGMSTNQQRIYFFEGYLRLAIISVGMFFFGFENPMFCSISCWDCNFDVNYLELQTNLFYKYHTLFYKYHKP